MTKDERQTGDMSPRKSERGTAAGAGVKILMGAVRLAAIASMQAIAIIGISSMQVRAEESFGSEGVRFDVDTIVEFEFVESHGAYQSTFGVINLDTGEKTPLLVEVKPADSDDPVVNKRTDFLSTPGNAVPQPLAEFKFKAKTQYAFYLESAYASKPAGILYSINARNPGGNEQARFDSNIAGLSGGGSLIRWDDTGAVLVRPERDDKDFNDFIIRSGGHIACPYNNKTSSDRLGKQLKGNSSQVCRYSRKSS